MLPCLVSTEPIGQLPTSTRGHIGVNHRPRLREAKGTCLLLPRRFLFTLRYHDKRNPRGEVPKHWPCATADFLQKCEEVKVRSHE